ncbi:TPA_exp: Uncharacterized protein A8136_0926 [Trichophyton benhamiae CBS 112371]|uniref:Asl1-like glycosyl hydrolase catalytic domain-containing protein n=1 Tax=Arthroderma benhamiae (strain ATCC MYA-4681 / CBS 112371) TaxID=663331 RepID=D4AUN7_ARTBC|nr:uncharacterized protein ARB_07954 [Trichophyton benhamiae CBS 112371]EFE33202.1 conserved hypothetical protein [Trichophyton benhamiae CBS 112371]DAA76254.1 TPA_exp: Uncharacterized protein A8136_0926 [Trichophyton benhamiae CBS 112371]
MVSFNALFVAAALASSVIGAPVQGANGGKRGMAYNDPQAVAAFKGTRASAWAYNWGSNSNNIGNGIDYAPMLWGQKFFNDWTKSTPSILSTGCKYVLSFNEPDIPSQANMSPQDAIQAHKQYMKPFVGKASIGSPAVSNGGGEMGLSWLGKFLDGCAGQCNIDFLNVHWYDSAQNVDAFKKHITDSINLAHKHNIDKIWLTEFRGDGDENSQVQFLHQVLPWLDSNPGVARYSYFMADDLVKGGQLTPVGQAYAS